MGGNPLAILPLALCATREGAVARMWRWPLHLAALVALWRPCAAEYKLWHAVDVQMVVCDVLPAPDPLPQGMTAEMWPKEQEYRIGIDYEGSDMDPSKPHVVTFFHSGSNPVDVTFQIDDAHGSQVLASQKVTLEAPINTPRSSCTCTGNNTGVDTVKFGTDYGKTCSTWDSASCTTWFPGLTMGEWCCTAWCYVDSGCEDSLPSVELPGLRYSYAGACATTPAASPCNYAPPDPCQCTNVDSDEAWSAPNITTFGAAYGATCRTWDYNDCGDKYAPDVLDYWCCASWCWVSETCTTSIASNVWPGLFWADVPCADDVQLVNTCPFKKSTGLDAAELATRTAAERDPACECMGWSPPLLSAGRRRAGKAFPSSYGSICAAWDSQYCQEYYPKDAADMWCCQSWCYVDEDCGSANPSMVLPGSFWSYDSCKDDGPTLRDCKYSSACRPSGSNTGLSQADYTKFGNDFGTSCAAWDKDTCAEWYSSVEGWEAGHNHWCCDSWAYVNVSCPLSEKSWEAENLFFSYGICEDDPLLEVYNDSLNACERNSSARRLADQLAEEQLMPPSIVSATARQLAARRRGASGSRRRSSSSSVSSPRRRTTSPRRRSATRTSDTSRRRAVVADDRRRAPPPAVDASRRRAPLPAPTSPRRRAELPARRRDPVVAPAAEGRRRAPAGFESRRRSPPSEPKPASPISPAPSPPTLPRRRRTPPVQPLPTDSQRRRTMDYSGQSFSTGTTRRRVTADTSPRRRDVAYGYGGRNDLQQNYGYTMPAKTDYGYSGTGPGKSSMMPMVLAGVGGLAAGTALGVGGYYVYSQMYSNNWGSGVTYNDRSWCSVPSGQYEGRLIRCADCMQAFGSVNCKSNNDCYGEGGCSLQLPQNTRRDDIMNGGGFVPQDFTPPLVLTITKIAGMDYQKSNVCPAAQPTGNFDDNWVQKSSLDLSLFVTLTQMTDFTPPSPPPSPSPSPGNDPTEGIVSDGVWPHNICRWPTLLAVAAAFFARR